MSDPVRFLVSFGQAVSTMAFGVWATVPVMSNAGMAMTAPASVATSNISPAATANRSGLATRRFPSTWETKTSICGRPCEKQIVRPSRVVLTTPWPVKSLSGPVTRRGRPRARWPDAWTRSSQIRSACDVAEVSA